MTMKKGIFWVVNDEKETNLISVTVECDIYGNSLDDTVKFSSKSGENFNHKIEWSKLPRSITHNKQFNYYPRGRVEIKNGRIKIFAHPFSCSKEILELINGEFCLEDCETRIKVVSDNSWHYKCVTHHQL